MQVQFAVLSNSIDQKANIRLLIPLNIRRQVMRHDLAHVQAILHRLLLKLLTELQDQQLENDALQVVLLALRELVEQSEQLRKRRDFNELVLVLQVALQQQ